MVSLVLTLSRRARARRAPDTPGSIRARARRARALDSHSREEKERTSERRTSPLALASCSPLFFPPLALLGGALCSRRTCPSLPPPPFLSLSFFSISRLFRSASLPRSSRPIPFQTTRNSAQQSPHRNHDDLFFFLFPPPQQQRPPPLRRPRHLCGRALGRPRRLSRGADSQRPVGRRDQLAQDP